MAKSKSSAVTTTSSDKKENSVFKYFRDTRAELRKVTWPTQEEAKNLTIIIAIATVVMAVFLGTLDYIFQTVVGYVIGGDPIGIGAAVVLFIAVAAAFYFNGQSE